MCVPVNRHMASHLRFLAAAEWYGHDEPSVWKLSGKRLLSQDWMACPVAPPAHVQGLAEASRPYLPCFSARGG